MKLFDMPRESAFDEAVFLEEDPTMDAKEREAAWREPGTTFTVLPAHEKGQPDVFNHVVVAGFGGQFKDGGFYQVRDFAATAKWAAPILKAALAEEPVNRPSLEFAIDDILANGEQYKANGFTEEDFQNAQKAAFFLGFEKMLESLGIQV